MVEGRRERGRDGKRSRKHFAVSLGGSESCKRNHYLQSTKKNETELIYEALKLFPPLLPPSFLLVAFLLILLRSFARDDDGLHPTLSSLLPWDLTCPSIELLHHDLILIKVFVTLVDVDFNRVVVGENDESVGFGIEDDCE